MGHDIREAKGSEKKRRGFELTAAECSKSALVVRVNEHELELPTVVQVINNNSDVIQYVVLRVCRSTQIPEREVRIRGKIILLSSVGRACGC